MQLGKKYWCVTGNCCFHLQSKIMVVEE